MSAKIISQKKFAKLVASTGALSQSPGALTRLSNLLFTQRGSLQIADGTSYFNIFAYLVSATYTLLEWIAAYSNYSYSQSTYLNALAQSAAPTIPNNWGAAFSAVANAGAATNPAGTYSFGIVAIGSASGNDHTAMSPGLGTESVINPASAFPGINFSWTPTAGVYGYQIYLLTNGGGFRPPSPSAVALIATVAGAGSNSYTFTGALPAFAGPYYNTNTTQYHSLFVWPGGSISWYPVTAGLFPGVPRQPAVLNVADPNWAASVGAIPGFSPYGGILGAVCPIPTMVQFAGQEILILGNGYQPQAYLPSQLAAATPTALANTFQAAYPAWQASVDWLTGAQVTDGAGNFYTATQGGVSQTPGPPTWNTTKGTETADGSVIWTSNGPLIASVAPRGAAHAVAYAGSLWLANTSPSTTSDGIDGPTCLKMSDSNNPNSWNPVNTAFIGRDDGTQITGLQPFTIAALGISPTGSLCVFNEYQTYQVIGVFGSTSFEIQPAQTNLGCLAARSIQFLPGFGVVRWTHLGFAVFDGINDRLISEDIRPYLFGGVDSEADLTPIDTTYAYLSQSAQTTTPPMYLCAMPLAGAPGPSGGIGSGLLTRIFCYDLVMKAWAILDIPWAISSLNTTKTGEGSPIVVLGKTNGQVERMQSGDVQWDVGNGPSSGSNINWAFRTPDVFGEGSSQRLFYQQAVIRGYGSAAMVQSIIATLWVDGLNIGAQGIDIVPMGGGNLFEANVKLYVNGERAHLDISGNNGGSGGVIDAVDWAVVPKSTMARRIIS